MNVLVDIAVKTYKTLHPRRGQGDTTADLDNATRGDEADPADDPDTANSADTGTAFADMMTAMLKRSESDDVPGSEEKPFATEDTEVVNPDDILQDEILKEMLAFRSTGEKTTKLKTLQQDLATIQPTSVEAERAFSMAGLFITKIRGRIEDSTLNRYIFMRHLLVKRLRPEKKSDKKNGKS